MSLSDKLLEAIKLFDLDPAGTMYQEGFLDGLIAVVEMATGKQCGNAAEAKQALFDQMTESELRRLIVQNYGRPTMMFGSGPQTSVAAPIGGKE